MASCSNGDQRIVGRFVVGLLIIAAVLLGATYHIESPIYRYFCFGMSLSGLLVATWVFAMAKFCALTQAPSTSTVC